MRGVKSFLKTAKFLVISSMFVGLASIAACSDSRTPEEIVKERSQQRLNELLINGSVAGALAYATPAYQKLTTPQRYNARVEGAARWTKAVVDEVSCEQDVCKVKVMVTYKLHARKVENTRPLDEKWIRLDGQWWYYEH